MKIVQLFFERNMCSCFSIFCAETVQLIFFNIEDCMAASINISMFLKERAAASQRYHWTTASEGKCAAYSFTIC